MAVWSGVRRGSQLCRPCRVRKGAWCRAAAAAAAGRQATTRLPRSVEGQVLPATPLPAHTAAAALLPCSLMLGRQPHLTPIKFFVVKRCRLTHSTAFICCQAMGRALHSTAAHAQRCCRAAAASAAGAGQPASPPARQPCRPAYCLFFLTLVRQRPAPPWQPPPPPFPAPPAAPLASPAGMPG